MRPISLLLLSFLLASCSSLPPSSQVRSNTDLEVPEQITPDASATPSLPAPRDRDLPEDPTDVWERLRNGFTLTVNYEHPSVARQLKRYRQQQDYFDLVIDRAQPFLFEVIEQVEQRGLPLELALVPFVESAFNPDAYSHRNAAGLWQFVSATWRSYGLEQTWWIDERRDPMKATGAALDYLESLYDEFDQDWLLALAAYNTGSGNVRRALRKQKKNN